MSRELCERFEKMKISEQEDGSDPEKTILYDPDESCVVVEPENETREQNEIFEVLDSPPPNTEAAANHGLNEINDNNSETFEVLDSPPPNTEAAANHGLNNINDITDLEESVIFVSETTKSSMAREEIEGAEGAKRPVPRGVLQAIPNDIQEPAGEVKVDLNPAVSVFRFTIQNKFNLSNEVLREKNRRNS
jgi:hypothetical protein